MRGYELDAHMRDFAKAYKSWVAARDQIDALFDGAFVVLATLAAQNAVEGRVIARKAKYPWRRAVRLIGATARAKKNMAPLSVLKIRAENAKTLGVDLADIDLTTPLAYLPVGDLPVEALPDESEAEETE